MTFSKAKIVVFLGVFSASLSQARPGRVIYGEDNRQDLYESSQEAWLVAARSTAALVEKKNLYINPDSELGMIQSDHYGESMKLCSYEKFYSQPSAAFCSGFLIAPDLLATAGHCIDNSSCGDTAFLFDFGYSTPDQNLSLVHRDNVFYCQEIVVSAEEKNGADYAVVKLDRAVTQREPLKIAVNSSLKKDSELLVIGHPSGLPTKLGTGKVRTNFLEGYFSTTLDTYGGNSGSAVLSVSTLEVEGILVRGESDYYFNYQDFCYESNVCAENDCMGEEVTRASYLLPFISR